MFFHKPQPKLENKILDRINLFVNEVNSNSSLSEFIDVFGITGPAARGQASSRGSDIDFYCITSQLSPLKSILLRNKFVNLFKDLPIEVELLIFSPNIYKKPDLMYYEFTSSGKILYGRIRKKPKLSQIPKWEAIQLLTYRGGPFFNAYSNRNIEYEYSKLILGIGEAILLMEEDYIADNHKRFSKILISKSAKKLIGFIPEYRKAYNFRYKSKSFNTSKSNLYSKGNLILKEAWKQILKSYFNKSYSDAIQELTKIKPTLPIHFGNLFFYTFNNLRFNKKLRVTFRNPYIQEILLTQKYLSNPKKYSRLRSKICVSWKAAPRFWKKD